MSVEKEETESTIKGEHEKQESMMGVVKRRWPAFVSTVYGPFHYPSNWFSIQIIFWCALFWPGDPLELHYPELSYLYGLIYITGACTRLVYGYLADRVSRVKLMGIMVIGENVGYFCIGFIPEGLGFTSYAWLMLFVILRELFTAMDVVKTAYMDDAIEESKRSQVLGFMQLLSMLVSVIAMVAIPLLLRTYWRLLFFAIGGFGMSIGVVTLVKAEEPPRGAEKQELKNLIKQGNVNYKFTLNRKTARETLLSRTNIIILVEGIFTQVILAVPTLLAFAYIESPPFNVSPLSVSLAGLCFAVPGSILGAVGFAKVSDRLARKRIKNRISLLFVSLLAVYFVWMILFFIPFKHLTPDEGDNFLFLFTDWTYVA
nr:MFS transporter [Candidatus Sigynarchaeota archaeon]